MVKPPQSPILHFLVHIVSYTWNVSLCTVQHCISGLHVISWHVMAYLSTGLRLMALSQNAATNSKPWPYWAARSDKPPCAAHSHSCTISWDTLNVIPGGLMLQCRTARTKSPFAASKDCMADKARCLTPLGRCMTLYRRLLLLHSKAMQIESPLAVGFPVHRCHMRPTATSAFHVLCAVPTSRGLSQHPGLGRRSRNSCSDACLHKALLCIASQVLSGHKLCSCSLVPQPQKLTVGHLLVFWAADQGQCF